MSESRRSFTREDPDSRKEALIRATLSLMAEAGPSAATVRAIADEAGISQGMIRHYFSTKAELVNAAYEVYMADQIAATDVAGGGTARGRLARIVRASLTPPVIDPRAISLWAGFIHMVRRDPAMRATHRKSYLRFRDRLEDVIGEALAEAGPHGVGAGTAQSGDCLQRRAGRALAGRRCAARGVRRQGARDHRVVRRRRARGS